MMPEVAAIKLINIDSFLIPKFMLVSFLLEIRKVQDCYRDFCDCKAANSK
jgi:hypothetical protein